MTRYAAETSVSSEKSRSEVERTLIRYGADGFMYGWEGGQAGIRFRFAGRHIAFMLPLPRRDDPAFTRTPDRGFARSAAQAEAAYEQAVRQRWRALALVIKAKLEAVESGITTADDEFLAHIVLPDGQTFGAWARPQLEAAYTRGLMPTSVLGLAPPREA